MVRLGLSLTSALSLPSFSESPGGSMRLVTRGSENGHIITLSCAALSSNCPSQVTRGQPALSHLTWASKQSPTVAHTGPQTAGLFILEEVSSSRHRLSGHCSAHKPRGPNLLAFRSSRLSSLLFVSKHLLSYIFEFVQWVPMYFQTSRLP